MREKIAIDRKDLRLPGNTRLQRVFCGLHPEGFLRERDQSVALDKPPKFGRTWKFGEYQAIRSGGICIDEKDLIQIRIILYIDL